MLAFATPFDDLLMPSPLLRHLEALHLQKRRRTLIGERSAETAHLAETADKYSLTLLLPGLRHDDLKVTADGNVLSIQGETKSRFQHVKIDRQFRLPQDADPDAVSVTLSDGVLTVTAPKRAACEARALPIDDMLTEEKDEGAYSTTLLLPGLRLSDLQATVENGVLSLAGETKTVHRHVRVDRRIKLPSDVDLDTLRLGLVDGVLTVAASRVSPAVRQLKVGTAAVEEPAMAEAPSEPMAKAPSAAPVLAAEEEE